ncbi:MAG: haloacid dehalogenase superfamily protein subfamily variant 3 with third motif having or [Solirubrobacterales bacterium]|nr:haloacid dehalogenase superfamily protein subfamily variant 3 with third motif having or [Solirubrobacterales bacterium]
MSAILFGSISTIADTSELQREAFNEAFRTHGLDWQWDREEYRALLEHSGGQNRIAAYAEQTGTEVDAAAIHATKSELFQTRVADSGIVPREGVRETIAAGRAEGFKVAIVTTTSRANVTALLDALAPAVGQDDFDLITDATSVEQPKPDSAAYAYALEHLGEPASACVAIEDNLGGVDAALGAHVPVIAFPNGNTAGHDFTRASASVSAQELRFDELRSLLPTA